MNPEQLAEWALCFGLQAEQTDYEADCVPIYSLKKADDQRGNGMKHLHSLFWPFEHKQAKKVALSLCLLISVSMKTLPIAIIATSVTLSQAQAAETPGIPVDWQHVENTVIGEG